MIRIGNGIDVHRFEENRKLILGGVEIPHTKGLLGHSDADVLTHSVMDALLGALALGDIGKWFPDNDPKYKDADSLLLLKTIFTEIELKGWKLENLDCTIIAENPKLSPYIDEMRENLAEVLKSPKERVSVKATTTEKLGFCGREEGIVSMACVLIGKD